MERTSAVTGATCYLDSKKIGDEVDFTMPAIEFTTAEINGLGTINIPIYSLVEDMEFSITRIGMGDSIEKYMTLGKNAFEFRWVEDYIDANGNMKHRGNKLYVTMYPKQILNDIEVKPGDSTERTHTYTVTRIQLKVDTVEKYLIDKISGVVKVNGKDMLSDINKLL